MSFERGFLNSTFTMVALGVIAACISDPTVMSLYMLGMTIPSIAIAYFWTVHRDGNALPNWLINLMGVLGFSIAIFGTLRWISTLLPFLHYLSLIQCLKLWQQRKTRDYTLLYAVSVVQVSCGSAITLDLQFGILFIIYLFTGFGTLVLFYLKREAEKGTGFFIESAEAKSFHELEAKEVKRTLRTGLGVMLGIVLCVAVSLFLILPRYHLRVFRIQTPGKKALVGFSRDIKLGDIGEIKDNPKTVMRVKLSRGGKPIRLQNSPLLWRGVSTDHYQYGRWRTNRFANFRLFRRKKRWWPSSRRPKWFDSKHGQFLPPFHTQIWPPVPSIKTIDETSIRQEITLESIGTNVLFSLYPPVRYDMPADAEDISLEVHHWNAKFDARIPRLAYVVYSQPYQWTERDLEQAPLNLSKLTHFMRTYFIQVPENIRLDGNLPELAITIVTQANIKNPYQAVKAIQQWLETNCKYTRLPGVLKKKPTDDPVLSFLFETRKGHCEYFATAQALLTRALGIPARVVNGFRGGEWNELGQFYLIRQRDAHSWVEVYLDNVGWFPVDPSPKEEERRFAFQSHLFSKYYNYFQSLWDRSVISYSPNRIGFSYNPIKSLYFNFQAIAARSAHGLNLEGSESIKTIIGKLAVGFLFLFGLCVMIVLVFKGWRIFWTVIRPGKSSNSGKSSIRFYDEMLRLLDRRGFYRAENRTPAEFAQELISIKGSTYAPIEKITHFYYKSRYAEKRLTESETQEVRSLLKELIQRLKHER